MKYYMGSILSVALMIDEYEKMNGRRCHGPRQSGYTKLPTEDYIEKCKCD